MHSYWEPPSITSLLLSASVHQLQLLLLFRATFQAHGACSILKRKILRWSVTLRWFTAVQCEIVALNRWSVTFSVINVTGQCNSLSGQSEDTYTPGGEVCVCVCVCDRNGFGGCLKTDGRCQTSPAITTPGRVLCRL